MRKELEPGVLEKFVSYDFVLPDGVTRKWFCAKDLVSFGDLLEMGEALIETSLLTGQEIQLCGEARFINKIGETLSRGARQAVTVRWGGNRFFEYSLRDETRPKALQWERHEKFYSITQVHPRDDKQYEFLRALMIGSFGTLFEERLRIEKVLPAAIADIKNNIYLVFEKRSGKAVGSFTIKYLPELEEVQLHSVAGRSLHPLDPRVLQAPAKLPILMAALLATIDDHYPQGEKYGIAGQSYLSFDGVEKLTFSASAKALLKRYRELGFNYSDRAGIVFRPISYF